MVVGQKEPEDLDHWLSSLLLPFVNVHLLPYYAEWKPQVPAAAAAVLPQPPALKKQAAGELIQSGQLSCG